MFSEFSLFLLYHVVWVCVVVGGWMVVSRRLLSLNPTTVMVILFLGLWLLLACNNFVFEGPKYEFRRPALHFIPPTRIKNCRVVYSYLLAPLKGEGGKNRRKMSQKEGKIILCPFYHILWLLQLNAWGILWPFPVTLSSQNIIMNTICKTRINLIFPFERK